MRVALEEAISPPGATLAQYGLPMDAVLKVYDHRFTTSVRHSWNLKAFDPDHEAEYAAYVNGPHAARTPAEMFEGGIEAAEEYLDPNDDNHILREHYIALTIASYFTSERNAYEQLSSLQGWDIPTFYGTTRFLGGEDAPNLDLTKPGILLQYIKGIDLAHTRRDRVDMYSRLGVANFGMRLENFIVKPDGSGVVMINLANTQLRKAGITDYEWKKEKSMYDEEGQLVDRVTFAWDWEFKYIYQWRIDD
ncbi:hypothetical protein RSOL_406020, partial [Rhizoctonia solani AG-3 Rhs1AP]